MREVPLTLVVIGKNGHFTGGQCSAVIHWGTVGKNAAYTGGQLKECPLLQIAVMIIGASGGYQTVKKALALWSGISARTMQRTLCNLWRNSRVSWNPGWEVVNSGSGWQPKYMHFLKTRWSMAAPTFPSSQISYRDLLTHPSNNCCFMYDLYLKKKISVLVFVCQDTMQINVISWLLHWRLWSHEFIKYT